MAELAKGIPKRFTVQFNGISELTVEETIHIIRTGICRSQAALELTGGSLNINMENDEMAMDRIKAEEVLKNKIITDLNSNKQ